MRIKLKVTFLIAMRLVVSADLEFKGLAAGRSASPAGSIFRIPPAAMAVVMINRVRRIDLMDEAPDTRADFFARVTIGDSETTSPVIESQDNITPQWTFSHETRGEVVPIIIKLFDKDDGGFDDHCDINLRAGTKDIRINYNLVTGRITGDVTGVRERLIRVHGAGDPKRAEIWFTVSSR